MNRVLSEKKIILPKCPNCECKKYFAEINSWEEEELEIIATCANCDTEYVIEFMAVNQD